MVVIWKVRNRAMFDDYLQLLHVSMDEIATTQMQLIQYFQHHSRDPSIHADIQVQQSTTNGSMLNRENVNVFEVGCKNLSNPGQNHGILIIDGA